MKRAIFSLLVLVSAITLVPAQEDLLVGVTWSDSLLVTFDPVQGKIVEAHLQLDPLRRFRGLAYDRMHHRLYALAQGSQDLYLIDPGGPSVRHLGNLRLDQEFGESLDAGALAYDPGADRLLVAVEHWSGAEGAEAWSELGAVDLDTLAVSRIGVVSGTFLTSLGMEESTGRIIALAVDGSGAWDDPRLSRVLEVNPESAETTELMATPYHTIMGVAFGAGVPFHAWVNSAEQFFALVDPGAGTVSRLGSSDRAPILSAMVRRDFPIRSRIFPEPAMPEVFRIGGVVEEIRDEGGVLKGQVRPGMRFEGRLAYDASAPYRHADPNRGQEYGLSVNLHTDAWSTRGAQVVAVNNRYRGPDKGAEDRFEVSGTTRSGVQVIWSLGDPDGVALEDDSILPDSFDLSDWPENRLAIHGRVKRYGLSSRFEIFGRVDRITPNGRRGGDRGKDRPHR